MSDAEVLLSMRESDCAAVIRDVLEKRLTQREAALRLELSVRQVKRLATRFRDRGAAGLVSGWRGKRSNNATAPAVRRAALDLVRKRYPDFDPTFACEQLVEAHDFKLSAETLRDWMIEEGRWQQRKLGNFTSVLTVASFENAPGFWSRCLTKMLLSRF